MHSLKIIRDGTSSALYDFYFDTRPNAKVNSSSVRVRTCSKMSSETYYVNYVAGGSRLSLDGKICFMYQLTMRGEFIPGRKTV